MKFFALLSAYRAVILVIALGVMTTGVAFFFAVLEVQREIHADFEVRSYRLARQAQTRFTALESSLRLVRDMLENLSTASPAGLRNTPLPIPRESMAIPGVRGLVLTRAQLTEDKNAPPAGIEVLAMGSGAKTISGLPPFGIAPDEFGRALRAAVDAKGGVVHAYLKSSGENAAMYLEPLSIKEGAAGTGFALVAELDVARLLGEEIEGFRLLVDGEKIERYSIGFFVAGQGSASQRFFTDRLAGNQEGPRPENWASLIHSGWMHFERPIQVAASQLRIATSVPRDEIEAPEGALMWWVLLLGLALTLATAVMVARNVKARAEAEDVSKRLGSIARHSEARFRNLVESTRDWMWETDANGRIIYSSGGVLNQLGREPAEIVGRQFREIGVDIDLDRAAGAAARVEVPARNKQDEPLWLQCACSRYLDDKGFAAGFRGVCIDVTERRRSVEAQRNLEIELNRLDKLGALEHVMSMVAHELNQPLAAVSSYCGASIRMLRANPDNLDEVIAALTAASSQAKAASDAVRGIRQFVSRREPSIGAERIEQLVSDALSLTEFRISREHVNVQTSFTPGLPLVRADRILIVQVLLNLLHNALDSLVGTAEPVIVVSAWAENADWVQVTVSDNGPGLTEEGLARGLEPYFTTKTTGLGLGLSIAQTIIESHGGELTLRNNPGGGCVARFNLEVSARAASSEVMAELAGPRY